MIQQINSKQTFLVRHAVLRQGKPIESCSFVGDDLATTIHFGYFEDNVLIGVVSVFKNDNPNSLFFEKELGETFQIRGMAVLENHQGKGIGQKLIFACEEYVKKKSGNTIWFNARINAVAFYEKMDYIVVGDSFEISEIGTHFLMKKHFIDKIFS